MGLRSATRHSAIVLIAALSIVASCAGSYLGTPTILPTRSGYWIWHDGTRWHLWVTPGRSPHRYHGWIVSTPPGSDRPELHHRFRTTLRASNADWQQGTGQSDQGIAFDVTTSEPGGISWVARYARFEIAIDGFYNARQVWLGPQAVRPATVPFTVEEP